MPLDLFRNRGYSVTILTSFLTAMGFFGAIVYLPLWFQTVKEISPTDSGLQTLALLAGLIVGSIVSGVLVSRTGKYKCSSSGSLVVMTLGLFLMTGLTATTDQLSLSIWMFLTGLGIGPAFSVLTIVVQSVVPFERPGRRDRQPDLLPPDRRLGRAGHLRHAVRERLQGPARAAADRRPACRRRQACDSSVRRHGRGLTQVGRRRPGRPWPPSRQLQQFADQIVQGIFEAFSLAIANAFWLGVHRGRHRPGRWSSWHSPRSRCAAWDAKADMEPATGGQPVVPVIAE